jgi:hypothetical protein
VERYSLFINLVFANSGCQKVLKRLPPVCHKKEKKDALLTASNVKTKDILIFLHFLYHINYFL